jgi:hypothetical protein
MGASDSDRSRPAAELREPPHRGIRIATAVRAGHPHDPRVAMLGWDVVLEPLDFVARLQALVPSPRTQQARYHGVLCIGSQNG